MNQPWPRWNAKKLSLSHRLTLSTSGTPRRSTTDNLSNPSNGFPSRKSFFRPCSGCIINGVKFSREIGSAGTLFTRGESYFIPRPVLPLFFLRLCKKCNGHWAVVGTSDGSRTMDECSRNREWSRAERSTEHVHIIPKFGYAQYDFLWFRHCSSIQEDRDPVIYFGNLVWRIGPPCLLSSISRGWYEFT